MAAKNSMALQYATDELRGNRDFMLKEVVACYISLQYASEELRGDPDFMMEAATRNYLALHSASPALRSSGMETYNSGLKKTRPFRFLLLESVVLDWSVLAFFGGRSPAKLWQSMRGTVRKLQNSKVTF